MKQRIQKIIALAGIASRRGAEKLIEDGLVTVNGRVAKLGDKATVGVDHIKVNGKLINKFEETVYYAFNKPKNVLTTLSDPQKRPVITDYLKGIRQRVYPVGRLDFDSEGLVLLTNDGELAGKIMHPASKVPKTYHVKVKGIIDENALNSLRNGIRLTDGMTQPAKVRLLRTLAQNSWIEMTITEGKNRQIRRMLEAVGYDVIRLIRVAIDGINLGRLPVGAVRKLTPDEIKKLEAI